MNNIMNIIKIILRSVKSVSLLPTFDSLPSLAIISNFIVDYFLSYSITLYVMACVNLSGSSTSPLRTSSDII